ncbi:MAG: BrnT family toxin [Clostridia bacterium]|nr:BrnT family toxin [Clostridia bacterium]
MTLEFEWDAEKEALNIQKHGIDFETAKFVFDDPFLLELFDEDHSTVFEKRYKAIGRAGNTLTVLTVIYTERQRIRIISARFATKREEKSYYDRTF